jgi:hypothetical protein
MGKLAEAYVDLVVRDAAAMKQLDNVKAKVGNYADAMTKRFTAAFQGKMPGAGGGGDTAPKVDTSSYKALRAEIDMLTKDAAVLQAMLVNTDPISDKWKGLSADIGDIDKRIALLGDLAKNTVQGKMIASFEALGSKLKVIGGSMTRYVTLPLIAVAVAAIAVGNKFGITTEASERIKQSFQQIALEIAKALLPFLNVLANILSTVANTFSKLSPVIKTVLVIVAGLAALAGPILSLAGNFIYLAGALSKTALGVKVLNIALATSTKVMAAVRVAIMALEAAIPGWGWALLAITAIVTTLIVYWDKLRALFGKKMKPAFSPEDVKTMEKINQLTKDNAVSRAEASGDWIKAMQLERADELKGVKNHLLKQQINEKYDLAYQAKLQSIAKESNDKLIAEKNKTSDILADIEKRHVGKIAALRLDMNKETRDAQADGASLEHILAIEKDYADQIQTVKVNQAKEELQARRELSVITMQLNGQTYAAERQQIAITRQTAIDALVERRKLGEDVTQQIALENAKAAQLMQELNKKELDNKKAMWRSEIAAYREYESMRLRLSGKTYDAEIKDAYNATKTEMDLLDELAAKGEEVYSRRELAAAKYFETVQNLNRVYAEKEKAAAEDKLDFTRNLMGQLLGITRGDYSKQLFEINEREKKANEDAEKQAKTKEELTSYIAANAVIAARERLELNQAEIDKTNELTEAERARKREMVGWTSLGDIYKQAMVIGARGAMAPPSVKSNLDEKTLVNAARELSVLEKIAASTALTVGKLDAALGYS